jgi:HlyD family secretion protein
VIVSPIDGVVLIRNVEPGQTVASSLQAPELFVVAEDLSKMTLKIWVDEADIGVVKPEQPATFDVSAWPGQEFEAVVGRLSLSPTTTNNVVTYAAELHVDNKDGLLRPGMTANANVVTGKREGVLKVPNAALRFRPTVDTEAKGSPLVMAPRRRRSNSGGASAPAVGGRGSVYIMKAGAPEEVRVRTGRSDGRFTEIVEGELKEGDEVIVGLGQNAPDGKAGQ